MDTWREAYRDIVPDDYLEDLSYDEAERHPLRYRFLKYLATGTWT